MMRTGMSYETSDVPAGCRRKNLGAFAEENSIGRAVSLMKEVARDAKRDNVFVVKALAWVIETLREMLANRAEKGTWERRAFAAGVVAMMREVAGATYRGAGLG